MSPLLILQMHNVTFDVQGFVASMFYPDKQSLIDNYQLKVDIFPIQQTAPHEQAATTSTDKIPLHYLTHLDTFVFTSC